MNIFSFTAHFGSEEDCRLHFKEQRDKPKGHPVKGCLFLLNPFHKFRVGDGRVRELQLHVFCSLLSA